MVTFIFAPAFSISNYVFTLDAAFKVSTRGGLNVSSLADGSSDKYNHFHSCAVLINWFQTWSKDDDTNKYIPKQ